MIWPWRRGPDVPLSTLIFDVDGTLAETEEWHRQAFNLAFKNMNLGWEWSHTQYLDLLLVTGGKERIRHFATRHDTDFMSSPDAERRIKSLHKMKTGFYAKLIGSGDVKLRPGIERLMDEALSNGLRLAISTTTTRANVMNLLTATLGKNGADKFTTISAADSAEIKKPAPDVYVDVLDKLNCSAEDCITFEDSQNGLLSARRANIETVVTLSEFTSCDDHMDAIAVLSDLGEPDQPCTAVQGDLMGRDCVDLDLLHIWRQRPWLTGINAVEVSIG